MLKINIILNASNWTADGPRQWLNLGMFRDLIDDGQRIIDWT
jgi:hypothetical protein